MPVIKYKSYSTEFKLNAILDKSITCNSNTKYYWKSKGNEKLLQASLSNDSISLNRFLEHNNNDLIAVFEELFSFFKTWIDLSKKAQALFKKSRNKIVYLWEKLSKYVSIKHICNWFNISERTYFNWKNRIICKLTPSKECPNIYPNQLRDWERHILENDYFFNTKYSNYSISDLLGQVMADRKVIIGESLFYELASALGETEKRKPTRKNRKYLSLKASSPFEIIHMDKTKIPIKNTMGIWVSLIADNHSRTILGHIVNFSSHSKYTLQNLKETMMNHNLTEKSFRLITDDGSENKGEVRQFLKSQPLICHQIAQKDISYSNSMIESIIKHLKYRYLPKFSFDSVEELTNALNIAIEEYNNRPRKLHLGKTPLQVLHGNTITSEEYALLKEATRKERIEENRNFNCLKAFY